MPTNYEELIALANQRIGALRRGATFELRELIEPARWEVFPKGDRQMAGRLFKREVQEGRVPGVIHLETPKGQSNKYQKQ